MQKQVPSTLLPSCLPPSSSFASTFLSFPSLFVTSSWLVLVLLLPTPCPCPSPSHPLPYFSPSRPLLLLPLILLKLQHLCLVLPVPCLCSSLTLSLHLTLALSWYFLTKKGAKMTHTRNELADGTCAWFVLPRKVGQKVSSHSSSLPHSPYGESRADSRKCHLSDVKP